MTGHTHSDIDQFFSLMARMIFPRPAYTIEDLKKYVENCTNRYPVRAQMTKGVLDWKSFLGQHHQNLFNVTTAHVFRFFKRGNQVGSILFSPSPSPSPSPLPLPQPPHPAARMIFTACNSYGDIEGKVIGDLGCGTAALGIASIFMGAEFLIHLSSLTSPSLISPSLTSPPLP